jgi:hypothetical protein
MGDHLVRFCVHKKMQIREVKKESNTLLLWPCRTRSTVDKARHKLRKHCDGSLDLHTTNAVMAHDKAAQLTEKNEISLASFPVK